MKIIENKKINFTWRYVNHCLAQPQNLMHSDINNKKPNDVFKTVVDFSVCRS